MNGSKAFFEKYKIKKLLLILIIYGFVMAALFPKLSCGCTLGEPYFSLLITYLFIRGTHYIAMKYSENTFIISLVIGIFFYINYMAIGYGSFDDIILFFRNLF